MPAQTINVTAGQARYVGGTVTEQTGKDISNDTIVMALGPSNTTPPARTAGKSPDSDDAQDDKATRVVKLLIGAGYQPASDVYCWAWITDSPEIEPLCLDGPITII